MSDNNTVTLIRPIVRGKETIDKVTITEAMGQPGCLRGLKLYDVLQSDVDSMFKLLPRVTSPVLTEVELVTMDGRDFTQLTIMAVSFLAPPSAL
ncbi:phage tail assembly protein [Serratia marcescens]|nr:phage tail assembly protein [Serratia marcescens]